MGKVCTITIGAFFVISHLFGAGGIYDSFAITIISSNTTFYDLDANTINPVFEGANLGTFNTGDQLFLGGQLKSFKNNGTDVTGASIFYTIYLQGNRPASPSFTGISYGFQWNRGDSGAPPNLNNDGDQQWGTDVNGQNTSNLAQDIFDNLPLGVGTYVLEVYARITTNGVNADPEIFDNNDGGNYTATFVVATPLPVQLTRFTARARGKYAELSWATASEQDNDYFAVERSADGRQWQELGRVAGRGTTTLPQQYAYLDQAPLPGLSYYRLKQVDFDGQYEYHGPVSLRRDQAGGSMMAFPNPAHERLYVRLPQEAPEGRLRLLNALGQEVGAWPARAGAEGLPIEGLAPGLYLLLWTSERAGEAPLDAARIAIAR
jgi:hypothetical protein